VKVGVWIPPHCPGYDPETHLKLVCNPRTYRCKPKPSCDVPIDCDNEWCCNTITGAKDCKAKDTILLHEGKSWLCDPPEEFTNLVNKDIAKSTKNKKLDFI